MQLSFSGISIFQSTLSVRRATRCHPSRLGHRIAFQSTLSVRRATSSITYKDFMSRISIHALREESDCGRHAAFLD